MELVDAVEVLGLGDQQQLGVAARADQREGLQQVAVGEVLAGGQELALVLRALPPLSRRHAGSSLRNVYLTKWRSPWAIIAAVGPIARGRRLRR